MFTYHKIDAACDSSHQPVFLGNVRLTPFTETDRRYLALPATQLLHIDAIADTSFVSVKFTDVTIELNIVSPTAARFVICSSQINGQWQIQSAAGTWSTTTVAADAVTRHLRFMIPGDITLLAGPGNGKTFYIGLAGLLATDRLEFTGSIIAGKTTANSRTCVLDMNIASGESSVPYLR